MLLNKTFTDNDGDTAQFRVSRHDDGLVIDVHQKSTFRGDQNAITVFKLEQALAIRDALIEAYPPCAEPVQQETIAPEGQSVHYMATDTFGDQMSVRGSARRVAFDIQVRETGKYPHIMCLSEAETIVLRDALLKLAPLPVVQKPFVETAVEAAPQEFAVGEIEAFPVPQGITINIQSLTINA